MNVPKDKTHLNMSKNSRRLVAIQEALGQRYKIVQRIATGGFAEVYLAEHSQLGRKVAIKVLLPELAAHEDVVKRFQRESKWAAQLSHPNIIDIYDVGEGESGEDVYYFVMKFVEGETLAQRMERQQRIPPADSILIVKQLAGALAYANEHSVVHRDIKPSNIMLDVFGKPILMDFGVARVQYEGRFTKKGTLMGTPHYLAPEQPLGRPVDGRSDIYSLGIVFYEMLSGRPPFEGENPVAVIFKHVNETAMPLGQLVPELSPKLCAVVHKMIEKLPERRYQSAGEVVDDLESLSALYPVPTPATGWRTPGMTQPGQPSNSPNESEIKNCNDTVRMALERRDLPAAIQSVTKALQMDPSNQQVRDLLKITEELVMDEVNDLCEHLEFEGARHLLDLAQDAFPDSVESKAIVVERNRLLHEKLAAADRLYKDGKLDQASKRYQDFLETPAIYDFKIFHSLRRGAEDTLNLAGKQLKIMQPSERFVQLRRASLLVLLLASALAGLPYIMSNLQTPAIKPEHGAMTIKKASLPEHSETGKIRVTSDPSGAAIFVEDQQKGVTPFVIPDMPFGKHTLKAQLKGYKDLQQEFEVTPNDPDVEVSIALESSEPAAGVLAVQSTPSGAEIVIGGKLLGLTPKTFLHSPEGRYTVTLNRIGYDPYTGSIRVYKDQTATLNARLTESTETVEQSRAPVLSQVELTPGTFVSLDPEITPPKPITKTVVKYPDEAKNENLEGIVRLSILVTETGEVIDSKVVQSVDPILDEAASKGVRQWVYEPATKKGHPVSVWIPVSISFVQH